MKRLVFCLSIFLLLYGCRGKQLNIYDLISPEPLSVEIISGNYILPDTIVFVIPDPKIFKTVEDFTSILIPRHRIDIVPDGEGDVQYKLGETGLGDGGFIMDIGTGERIVIISETLKGLRLGTDALRQSVLFANPGLEKDTTVLPCATVKGGAL